MSAACIGSAKGDGIRKQRFTAEQARTRLFIETMISHLSPIWKQRIHLGQVLGKKKQDG
jgi:hypothetical protein